MSGGSSVECLQGNTPQVICNPNADQVLVEVPSGSPVVIEVGQQGPAGPPGPPGAGTQFDIQTDDAVVIGQPVYLKSPGGTLGLAQANAAGVSRVFGLAIEDQAALVSVEVATLGPVTRADWTPVIGAAALTPGAQYYLDPSTPGMLTATAPQGVGDYVTRVGVAATSDTLDIHIHRPILKT